MTSSNVKTLRIGQWFPVALIATLSLVTSLQAAEGDLLYTKRPVLEHNLSNENVDALQKKVADLMTLSDDELLATVPKQTPFMRVGCPHCRKDKPFDPHWDGQIASKTMNFAWTPKQPDHVSCEDCWKVFPGNKQYPMDKVEVIHDEDGDAIEVPYHFDPNKVTFAKAHAKNKPVGRKYHLHALVDYAKWDWLWPRLEALSKLYLLTGKEEYAHRAVLILSEYAANHQDFLFVDHNAYYTSTKGMKYPYGWRMSRWKDRLVLESMPQLLPVIDRIYTSASMDSLSARLKRDVRDDLWQMCERGLNRIMAGGYYNLHGPMVTGKEFLVIAKLFDRVDLAHLVYQSYLDYPRFAFSSDGHFLGGTGYHQIHAIIAGYIREDDPGTDPLAYKGKDRIDKLSHWYGRESFWRDFFYSRSAIRYPDGNKPVAGDSSAFSGIWATEGPREESTNVMRSGYKYAILGDGRKEDQIQVHTKFGENNGGHSHTDTLNFQLFAHGHLLNDSFARGGGILGGIIGRSIFKNGVVVNHENQRRAHSEADPVLYEPNLPGISVFSGDAARVYSEQGTTRYQRTLVLNTVDIKRPYIIDVFQIKGGKRHDYIMKSPRYFKSTASTDLEMAAMDGLRPLLPEGIKIKDPAAAGYKIGKVPEMYGLFYDVKTAAAAPSFYFDYKINEPWDMQQKEGRDGEHVHSRKYVPHLYSPDSWSDKGDVGTRHHVVGQAGQQAFLTEIPSLYEVGWDGDNSKPTYEWPSIPCFILRKDPQNADSETTFVVVHEPYYQSPKVTSAKRVDVGDPNVLALNIDFGDRSDTFVYSLTGDPVEVRHEGLSFNGTMGLVARQGGKTDAYLIAGSALSDSAGKINLKNDTPLYSGKVLSSTRTWDKLNKYNTLTVESDLEIPEGDAMRGQWIILKHRGTYRTYDGSNRKSMLVLDVEGGINHHGLNPRAIWERWYKNTAGPNPQLTEQDFGGGGHAFEIAHVEKRDGKTIIHTTSDHGLIIENGKTREEFFPMRAFSGETTFQIKTSRGTQAIPIVSPAGGNFVGKTKVSCNVASDVHTLKFAITAPSDNPAPGDWRDYAADLVIEQDADLHVKAVLKGTIKEANVSTYSFRAALKPDASMKDLQPGLVRKTWASLNFESTSPEVKTVAKLDAKDFVSVVGQRGDGKLAFEGFIRIDQPGVYTFHYLADRDGILKLGGKTLSAMGKTGQTRPVSRIVEVALLPGVYSFYCDVMSYKEPIGGAVRWAPDVRLDWSGPGFDRTTFPTNRFFHQVK